MKSLKTLAGVTLALGIAAGCVSPGTKAGSAAKDAADPRPVLRIYTWADYISPNVISRFERENGCQIAVDTFDSNESMFEKLLAGGTDYDIIMPTSYQIPLMVKKGMLRELDHARLPTVRRNFDRNYAGYIFDPTFAYNVPYAVSYGGIAYRKDKIGDAPIDSWKVFGTEALKGRMSLLDDMRETLGGALLSLGCSLNSTRAEDIARAAEVVVGWKANVTSFDNERYKEDIASGRFAVGQGYSSDSIQLAMKDGNVGFSLPKEGFSVAVDEMVVPAGARHVELAHRFIDFCYHPDVAATNMTDVCAPMPVAPAVPLLDAHTRRHVILDAGTLKNGEVLLELDDATLALYRKAWDRVKAGK